MPPVTNEELLQHLSALANEVLIVNVCKPNLIEFKSNSESKWIAGKVKVSFEGVADGNAHGRRPFSRQLAQASVASLAFNEHLQRRKAFTADDGIALPMPSFQPEVDLIRSLRDRRSRRQPK